jgi:hypothetical protein
MTSLATPPRKITAFGLEMPVLLPSRGAGALAEEMSDRLKQVQKHMITPAYSVTKRQTSKSINFSIEERLFDSRASLKVMTAAVAMHLKRPWRDGLFRQLDSLLAPESWDKDDKLVDVASYYTFLRMILYVQPARRPGLGLSYNGNLIAAWTVDVNRLTVECLPKDQLRWVLSRSIDDNLERVAGVTFIHRLPDVLAPYHPEIWFTNGEV